MKMLLIPVALLLALLAIEARAVTILSWEKRETLAEYQIQLMEQTVEMCEQYVITYYKDGELNKIKRAYIKSACYISLTHGIPFNLFEKIAIVTPSR